MTAPTLRTSAQSQSPIQAVDLASIGIEALDWLGATKLRHVAYWRQMLGGEASLRSLTTSVIMQALPMHTTHRYASPTPASAAEILSLLPTDVDLHRRQTWVRADNAKSGRARTVPLNDDAMQILRRRIPKAVTYVFERPSQRKFDAPIQDLSDGFAGL